MYFGVQYIVRVESGAFVYVDPDKLSLKSIHKEWRIQLCYLICNRFAFHKKLLRTDTGVVIISGCGFHVWSPGNLRFQNPVYGPDSKCHACSLLLMQRRGIQSKRAVRSPPRYRNPVGLESHRTRTISATVLTLALVALSRLHNLSPPFLLEKRWVLILKEFLEVIT